MQCYPISILYIHLSSLSDMAKNRIIFHPFILKTHLVQFTNLQSLILSTTIMLPDAATINFIYNTPDTCQDFFLTLDILRNNYCHWIERNDTSTGNHSTFRFQASINVKKKTINIFMVAIKLENIIGFCMSFNWYCCIVSIDLQVIHLRSSSHTKKLINNL